MFDGGETISIRLKQSGDSKLVEKTFYIDSIIGTSKVNETSELITLHFMEDIAFISRFLNVNKSYNGSPQAIIKKISEEFLNKEIHFANNDVFENKMKLVVPNAILSFL